MERLTFVTSLLGTSIAASRPRFLVAGAAPRFEFQSNFWVNLHHRLYKTADWADAQRRGLHVFGSGTTLLATPSRLPASQRQPWSDAVETYRRDYIVTRRDLLFDDGLEAISATLSNTPENKTPQGLPAATAQALAATAPIYRTDLWPADRRVNLAWIAELKPRVAVFGDAMQRRLSRIYDAAWPSEPFRVDVARYAHRLGA